MSAQTTNAISNVILTTACNAGGYALGAAAIASPIGSVGGALFGAIGSFTYKTLIILTEKRINVDQHEASTTAQIAAISLSLAGSIAISWGVLALGGHSLTASHTVTLSIASQIPTIGIGVLLNCLGHADRPQRAQPPAFQ